jgi:alpha-glucosidase
LRDNPENPGYQPTQAAINRYLQLHNADQAEVHDVVAEMRAVLDRYDERVLIGEIYLPVERLVAYYGRDLSGAHLPFNFQLVHAAWTAAEIARLVTEYEAALPPGGWPNWVLGNHDQPRIAARVGTAQARVAAMLLLTLRGTPTLYYGDEIGIARVPIAPEAMQDPWEKNEPGLGLSRDPSRTPFQWDNSPNAGFTDGRPWLPLDPEFAIHNVQALRDDPISILNLHRRLIALRRRHPALSIGSFRLMDVQGDVIVYQREWGGETIVVCLNFGNREQIVSVSVQFARLSILASTYLDRAGPIDDLALRPDEGVILVPD